jgi:hypothetical protein
MLDLIENAQVAIDDLIDVMGRATIEAVLLMSAAAVAGPKQQGKKAGRDIAYHGSQTGRVALKERQLRVTKPRLRKKAPRPGEAGEVEIPAYEAMRKDGRLADRMLEILLDGVSTRRYEGVLPAMAETVGSDGFGRWVAINHMRVSRRMACETVRLQEAPVAGPLSLRGHGRPGDPILSLSDGPATPRVFPDRRGDDDPGRLRAMRGAPVRPDRPGRDDDPLRPLQRIRGRPQARGGRRFRAQAGARPPAT